MPKEWGAIGIKESGHPLYLLLTVDAPHHKTQLGKIRQNIFLDKRMLPLWTMKIFVQKPLCRHLQMVSHTYSYSIPRAKVPVSDCKNTLFFPILQTNSRKNAFSSIIVS